MTACFRRADMKMHSTRTSLDLEVEDCSLSLCDLAYDTAFHYCDSLYSIALNRASILLPDSSMRIETNDLSNMDGGPLRIGKTLIAHTMGRTQLGEMVTILCRAWKCSSSIWTSCVISDILPKNLFLWFRKHL